MKIKNTLEKIYNSEIFKDLEIEIKKEKINNLKTKDDVYNFLVWEYNEKIRTFNNKKIKYKSIINQAIKNFFVDFYNNTYKDIIEFKITLNDKSEIDMASETMWTAIWYNKRCDEIEYSFTEYFEERLNELHKSFNNNQ